MPQPNQLFYGDNLTVLRERIPDSSVDLVYLDPPFNSRADYNVLFAEKDGSQSTSQITAFEDTWGWSLDAERGAFPKTQWNQYGFTPRDDSHPKSTR